MNGYDVEAHIESEIGMVKVEIKEACEAMRPHTEILELYVQLTDLYELRLAQWEQKEKDLRDVKDYYENNQPGY